MSKGHEHRQFFTFSLELNFFPDFFLVEFLPSPGGGAFWPKYLPLDGEIVTFCTIKFINLKMEFHNSKEWEKSTLKTSTSWNIIFSTI